MDYEQLFSNIASLASSFGLLTYITFKNKKVGLYTSALLYAISLVFNALELQYGCEIIDIVLIATLALIIFFNGFLIGREKGRGERDKWACEDSL